MTAPTPTPPDAVAAAKTEIVRNALNKALQALRPLRAAVYNNNGDMTVSGCHPDYEQCVRGYFASRDLENAIKLLAEEKTAALASRPDPRPGLERALEKTASTAEDIQHRTAISDAVNAFWTHDGKFTPCLIAVASSAFNSSRELLADAIRAELASLPPAGSPSPEGGAKIIEGLRQALAHAQGDESMATVRAYPAQTDTPAADPQDRGTVDEAMVERGAFAAGAEWAAKMADHLGTVAQTKAEEDAALVLSRAIRGALKDAALQAAITPDSGIEAARAEPGTWPPNQYRHVKSGGLYNVVGTGFLQSATPVGDMTLMVIYRSEKDGRLWVRPTSEFYDGRFEVGPANLRPATDRGVA